MCSVLGAIQFMSPLKYGHSGVNSRNTLTKKIKIRMEAATGKCEIKCAINSRTMEDVSRGTIAPTRTENRNFVPQKIQGVTKQSCAVHLILGIAPGEILALMHMGKMI